MDLILNLCDDYLLDKLWARLVPLSAFADAPMSPQTAALNASAHYAFVPPTAWSTLVSSLPHPPLPPLVLASPVDISAVSAWPRDYIPRQLISLLALTIIGIVLLYFVFAGLSYYLIFNHKMMEHPRFLKNQVRLEIQSSIAAFPGMTLLTLPWFLGEVRGYSKLYDDVSEYGWPYLVFSMLLYVFVISGLLW